jgi:ornithine carbamoyltransferase
MFKTNGSHNCKHFLNLSDLTKEELKEILALSAKLKKNRFGYLNELKNKSLAMIFEKNSTRTRISFEVGMQHLGGNSLFLSANDIQISRGEPLEHTAKVISSMVECVVMRCNSHADLEKMANHSSSPIINGLSDESHPCQLLADIFTIIERTGSI